MFEQRDLTRRPLFALAALLAVACATPADDESATSEEAASPASFRDYVLTDPATTAANAKAGTWLFNQSEITGGGLAMAIAADPWQTGYVTVGGDSWGLYNSRNGGNQWLPAMTGTAGQPMTGENGTFYYSGLAYSRKERGVVYGLLGHTDASNAGGFIVMDGYQVRRYTKSVTGEEPAESRHEHPRPNGNRVLVDYDSGTSTEFVYVAGGNGTGVFRTTDQGASFVSLGLAATLAPNDPITGMALDPANGNNLLVTTRDTKLYILQNIRGAASGVTVKTVSIAPQQFEELSVINGAIWAAARTKGIFKSTNGGTTWSAAGSFPSTVDLVTVGGSGEKIFAGCVADSKTPHCIYRSLDGGKTWGSVADNPGVTEWGSGRAWWHGKDASSLISGGGFVTSQIAVDAVDSNVVYVAGRAGVWKSEDSGDTWRPAVVGLGGTMHNKFGWDGTNIEVDDIDFDCFKTTPADHYQTPVETTCSFNRTTTLTVKAGTDTVQVVAATSAGVPAKFLVNGVDKADAWFKSGVTKPVDVYYADGYVYIAQYGGGVVLAHKK